MALTITQASVTLVQRLMILFLLLWPLNVFAEGLASLASPPLGSISFKPNRCVALRKGQVCYQSVKIEWQMPRANRYCLYRDTNNQPLHCWDNALSGELHYEFQSSRSQRFFLQQMQTGAVVLEEEVHVAWVYKTKKNPRLNWRLF